MPALAEKIIFKRLIFRYNKKIDKKIGSAVAAALRAKVLQSARIKSGEINYVYKIKTTRGDVVARVFRHKNWPEKNKLLWIEKELGKKNIPIAKILHYSRDSKYFRFGFMVSEYVSGQNAVAAIKQGAVSFAKFHQKLGSLLKKIKSIRLKKYGHINNGKGASINFLAATNNELKNIFKKLGPDKIFKSNIFAQTKNKIGSLLKPHLQKFEPVLTHGDPSPDNCIWTKDKKIVLVDWDTAISSIWPFDYFTCTYFGSHRDLPGSLESRQKKAKKSILKGYGKTAFSRKALDEIEQAVHIIVAVKMLPYYLRDQKNFKKFERTKKRLELLLAK